MKKIFFLTLAFILGLNLQNLNAQCTDCTTTVNNFTSSSNYTFTAGTKTCFTGTSTISHDVIFGNNASLCVEPGATLNFGANSYSVGSTSDLFTIDVWGTLNISQTPDWKGKMFINIHSQGTLYIPNTIKLNGPAITLTNDGTFTVGTIEFNQSGATITITNNSTMIVSNGTISRFYATAHLHI